jgi:protein-disulfide isomerase
VPQLEQLLIKYPSKVKVVFKNFPIRSHKYALKAAVAALAAEPLGKFWQFHDTLFNNYNRLNDQKIQEIVEVLGLDDTKFKEQQKNPAITERIRKDYEEGLRIGVRGTPTIFINGKKLRDRGMQSLEAAIEKELQKQQEKSQEETAQ